LHSRLVSVDWDFAGRPSESPFSSIHWHPARFASQIPATLIGLLTRPGEVVLDPFLGSGTTLVESQRLARSSIGIDVNPVACLLAEAKTVPTRATAISGLVTTILGDANELLQGDLLAGSPAETCPSTVQASKWYTPEVRRDLARLWHQIASYGPRKKLLAQAAFSALLLPVCKETRHWGYVCDNSTPRSRHGGDVLGTFGRVLSGLSNAYKRRDAELRARQGPDFDVVAAQVVRGDCRKLLADMPSGSIDCVITSPPYFGVVDYVKAQRLSMEWFQHEIEPIRLEEIGARSKRHRRTALQEYMDELRETFAAIRRVVRAGGYVALVFGESRSRDSVLDDVRSGLRAAGFEIELDLNRRVSSQRRQAPSVRGEHLLVLRR